MLPGDVFYYAANSSVLCVQRDELLQPPQEQQQQKNLHLNPAAPVFRQAGPDKGRSQTEGSPSSERDTTQAATTETAVPGQLTNGDVHVVSNGPGSGYMVSLQSGGSARSDSGHQATGSAGVVATAGLVTGGQGQLMTASQSTGQPATMVGVTPQPQQQGTYQLMQDTAGAFRQPQSAVPAVPVQQQVALAQGNANGSSETAVSENPASQPEAANGDGDSPLDNSAVDSDDDEPWDGIEKDYPEEVLLTIRRQIEYYFSAENLPNDKYLNQNMDKDKYVSLNVIAGFNRMRQICKDGKGQMIQAIKSSSVLELNEKKSRVRVTQTRKTLTLRGLPPRATEDDVKSVLRDNDCPVAMHIENIMVQNNVSNWYVSFENEAHCLDAFFKLHGSKAQLNGYTIGCCIKSSGTHAASGYFPSQEETQQRKIAHAQQGAAAGAPPTPISPQTQSQAALIQHQYGAMPIHHPSFMQAGHQSLYYPQGAHPQSMYMNPYVPQMITQGWPGAAGLDPGLVSIEAICLAYRQRRAASQQIMQNNGLQPQHIRTPMARPHLVQSGNAQHRFAKPPRSNRQSNLERSASERPSDRPSQVTVSGSQARSSPRNADGNGGALVPQGAYVPRRHDEVTAVMPQPPATQHQYITPLVTQPQQQQQHASNSGAVVAPNPAVMDPAAAATGQHFQPQQQHHQQPLMVQTGLGGNTTGTVPPQTNNPPPMGHHQSHHPHHHHHQPPPPLPHHHHQQQQQQQQHHSHHHHPPPPHHHQQQQQPSQPGAPHHPHPHHHHHHQPPPPHHQHVSVNQHHTQQPPPQPPPHHPHQQTGQGAGHHPHHQHGLMPPHHHHNHQLPPPPPGPQHQQQHHHHPQHQNAPQGGRNDRRPRRKREDNPRSSRQNERNQSNRANFSSQVPPVADNFTMEANSFPPLPGVTSNIASSENMFENKLADVVRGRPRLPGGTSASSSVASSVRATSTTPSPVATPAPNSVPAAAASISSAGTAGNTTASHPQSLPAPALVEVRSAEVCEPAADDEVASSSPDDDVDAGSQDVRVAPDVQGASDSLGAPLPQRGPKATTPVANVGAPGQRHMELAGRPSLGQPAPSVRPQPQQAAQQMVSPVCAVAPAEASGPKLSYAQIAAQKNREAAGNNGVNAAEPPAVAAVVANNVQATSGGNPSAPQTCAAPGGNSTYKAAPTGNGLREQQIGQPQANRTVPRATKDSSPRVEGPPNSRPVNGRRNSKENRAVAGKFDRRKGDGRAK
ncbi:la-related protein Larp4B isoform X2 [Aplysia californica]|uniref:La-related protein Larp4B isoform X2 n=1 Tax=Aplysia californica TaxID=6500 RepID=A0ABM1W0K0_APLCA|nr:la-related protein Larp4B isoform X2 [Aplysia californica]